MKLHLNSSLNLKLVKLTLTDRTFASDPVKIPIAAHLEILDSKWHDKNIQEITQATDWVPAYSEQGKTKQLFQGNWYRLYSSLK